MKTKLLLVLFLPLFSFGQTQLGDNFTNPNENNVKPSLFGISTAISADGTIVASGAPGNNEDSFVRVFKYVNNKWEQLGEDIENESILEKIGTSVSLSADGKVLAVGAVNGGDLDEGHIRIYEFINNKWDKIGQIVGDGTQFYLGYRVVLTPDAKFLATTAYRTNSSKKGFVRVYENISGTWTQIGTTLEGEFNYDAFGIALDISDDGSVLAVGNKGRQKAHVYKFENNDWSQIGDTFTNLKTTSSTGLSVSLSSNGNRVAIGSSTGVSIYENNADTWNIIGSKINYGSYSALSNDGNKLVIGYPRNYKVRNYIYENSSWSQRGVEVTAGSESLSISSDGDTFIAASDEVFPRVFSFNYALLSTNNYLLNNQIKIYPNPTENKLTISLLDDVNLKEVNIYNLLGKQVMHKKDISFEISFLEKGVYFVKISTDKGFITKKLIKK